MAGIDRVLSIQERFNGFLDLLESRDDPPVANTKAAMEFIADGVIPTEWIVRFLRVFNRRQPTVEELTAFVRVLRRRATPVNARAANTICNCGTGGDGRGTMNVSTVASFVIAACGVPVAKHGNRSVSSRSGSTDCLRCLGVAPSRNPAEAEKLLSSTGLCFMNAPDFHPAMRRVAEARAVLASEGQKTLFNLLGPLLNPAGVRHQCLGVYSDDWVEPLAEVLLMSGTRRAYVFSGDGYDEIALTGPTRFAAVANDSISVGSIEPESLGFERCQPEALVGGDPKENARIAESILSGQIDGPRRDIVILNAAAGISAGSEPEWSLVEAVDVARDALSSGRAFALLERMRRETTIGA